MRLYQRGTHLGIHSETSSEDRELRIFYLIDTEIPAESGERCVVEHVVSLPLAIFHVCHVGKRRVVDFHCCLSCIWQRFLQWVGRRTVCSYIASLVASAEDVVVLHKDEIVDIKELRIDADAKAVEHLTHLLLVLCHCRLQS